MKEKNSKVRKMFYEGLPKWENDVRYNGKIKWRSSVGYRVRFIYYEIEGWVEIVGYDGKYLYIKYQDKEPYKIFTGAFTNCELGKLLGVHSGEFKIQIGTTFKDDKRDLVIIDREYRKDNVDWNIKWYKYTCNKCGWTEGWATEYSLLKGNGCYCCCLASKKAVLGINTIWDTDRWMCDLGVSEEDAKKYTSGSNKKIKVICPDCGRVKSGEIEISNIYIKKSIGCSCSDSVSYPNKFICSFLNRQRNIDFQTEYIQEWSKQRKYDFYFEYNNEQYIIEAHGRQHYEEQGRKEARTIEEEQENDRFKKELALSNGIKEENYIVINCKKSEMEWIKDSILDSRLNELFDLSNIDWLKIEEFALKNLVKVACDYKKNDPEMTTTEIGEIMKLNRNTISRYLKKGTKLGWCEYDSKEEIIKNNNKSGERNKKFIAKPIEIFKNGISLGIIESAAELDRQSEDLFGVRLNFGNISAVCRGSRKSYKGFTFRFHDK